MAIGGCHRILVVDDHEDAAELLEEYLRGFGSEIRVAHDGASALRIAEEFRPELALVDIGMPAMDGYEVARRLRQQTHDPHLRVVAITGYSRDPERERAESAEFDAHLLKPVRAEKLTKVLEDLGGSSGCGSDARER
jgi:CheY-like chemotaxis protein